VNRERKYSLLQRIVLLTLLTAVIPLMAVAEGAQDSSSVGTTASNTFLQSLTKKEREWLRDHPVIRVVQDPGWPPIEFADERGEPSGMAGDYLNLIEKRLGMKFKRVRNLSWQEAYVRLKRWEIDMTTSVAVTPERAEFWAFTKPYMKIPIVIVAHSDVTYISDMRELAGEKVAVVEGYAVNDWIPRDFPEIRLVRVKTAEEGLERLQRGDVFACIENMLVVGYYMAKLKMTTLKIAGETPYVNAQSMAVRKDWPILAGILQKALDSISETERNDIYRKWLPIRYEHGFNYSLFWQALAIFAVILLGLVVWIQKLSREIRYRKKAEKSLGESEVKFRLVFESANVGKSMTLPTGEIDVNKAFCDMLGYTRDELRNKRWQELTPPDEIETIQKLLDPLLRGERDSARFNKRYVHKNGSHIWADVSVVIHRDADRKPQFFITTLIDITERILSEERIAGLTRLYSVLSKVNEAIIRIRDMETLYREICRIAVEEGKFSMAWIGIAGENETFIKPSAWWGNEKGYLKEIKIKMTETPEGLGPSGTAIREGKHNICNDWEKDPRMSPWRDAGRERGFRSSASFPLKTRGKIVGILNLYSGVPDFFTADEIRLIDSMAENLSFAIEMAKQDDLRVKAEEELSKSEEKFSKAFQNSPDPITITKMSDGKMIDVNESFCRVSGYSRDEVIGRSSIELDLWANSDDRGRYVAALRDKGRVINFETDYKTKSGEIRNFLVSGEIFDIWGDLYILGILPDITDRKRAAEALKESENKYRLLADNANDVIFVLDMNLNYAYVSPSVKFLRGYEPAEVLKQSPIETLTPSSWDLAMRTLSEVMELEKSGRTEIPISRTLQLEMRRKDGTTVWTEVSLSFIRDEDQRPVGILGVTRDITERKRAEEELHNTLKQLQESQDMLVRSEKLAAIGQLAAGVAHEILNPINIMGMKLQMLEMTEVISEKTKEAIRTCENQIKRVTKITRDLQQFARVSERQVTPSNINEQIEQVFSLMGPRIKTEDVKVDARYQADLPLVPLDRDRMGQVIMNLINNAIDAMKGRPERVLRVTTELTDKNVIRLSFSDTGTGISPEILGRIFYPFFTTKAEGKGTGLGLSISHGIIEDHGGTIRAENNEQGGATFFIELPVEESVVS